MLVHKATMGVLCFVPVGDGKRVAEAFFNILPELDPDEWWELRRGSALGRSINRAYPWCSPVTDKTGALIGVNWLSRYPDEAKKPSRTHRSWGRIVEKNLWKKRGN